LPAGKVAVKPPIESSEFVSWWKTLLITPRTSSLKKPMPEFNEFAVRTGLLLSEARELYQESFTEHARQVRLLEEKRSFESEQSKEAGKRTLSPSEENLLKKLLENKWSAFVEKDEIQTAHELAKKKFVYHVRDAHFLHSELYEDLLAWLNSHFAENETLTVDHARDYFQTGRKTFLEILEFCDRLGFTFRKDNARKRFRLPSSHRPFSSLPSNEREGATRSDRHRH
jgi:hypothetical protein